MQLLLYSVWLCYAGEGEERGNEEGVSRFARICGQILNAYIWKAVRGNPIIVVLVFV